MSDSGSGDPVAKPYPQPSATGDADDMNPAATPREPDDEYVGPWTHRTTWKLLVKRSDELESARARIRLLSTETCNLAARVIELEVAGDKLADELERERLDVSRPVREAVRAWRTLRRAEC